MANILIRVGTGSGTARMVPDTVKPVLEAAGSRSTPRRSHCPDTEALAWIEGWKQLV